MGRRGQALAVSSRTIRKAKAQEKILGFLLYGPITASISGRQSAVSSGTPSDREMKIPKGPGDVGCQSPGGVSLWSVHITIN